MQHGGPDGTLDRAIMAVAVSVSDEEGKTAKDIIESTQATLDIFQSSERACDMTRMGLQLMVKCAHGWILV